VAHRRAKPLDMLVLPRAFDRSRVGLSLRHGLSKAYDAISVFKQARGHSDGDIRAARYGPLVS
jgi:hypothetical protein